MGAFVWNNQAADDAVRPVCANDDAGAVLALIGLEYYF